MSNICAVSPGDLAKDDEMTINRVDGFCDPLSTKVEFCSLHSFFLIDSTILMYDKN